MASLATSGMVASAGNSAADKWFSAGVNEHRKFEAAWREVVVRGLTAGLYFMKAKSALPHGDWEMFLESRENGLKPRMVQRYMQFAEEVILWAKAQYPAITEAGVISKAGEVKLMSPKSLVALVREIRLMRQFGEYDAVKYAQKRLGAGQQQLELDFGKVVAAFDILEHVGEANFTFTLPEGKTEDQAWEELETKLENALEKVRARKGTVDVESVESVAAVE